MTLTAENTAIVLDSTADFPEAPERFPNWRVVPLYVLFGDESYRDYVDLGPDEFYARLRASSATPTTSQPTPADFLAAIRGALRSLRADLLAAHSRRCPGRLPEATTAAETLGGGKVRAIDSETASAAIAMLALRDPAPARARERPTRRSTRSSHGSRQSQGVLFTVDTLEFLRRGGRIGRASAWAGEPVARQADPHDPQGRGHTR